MMNSITQDKSTSKLVLFARRAAVIFLWLLLWHCFALYLNQPILLVSPLQVFQRLAELAALPSFWSAIGTSLQRIMAGFVLSTVVGILLAALAQNRILNDLLQPPMQLIKATPVASFTIMVLFWVHSRYLATVISFLMVLPIIFFNVYEGIAQTDTKLLDMAKVFKLSFVRRLRYIYIPSVWPYFLSAFSIALGQAWKSGIAAEVIALPNQSIGINLYNAKIYLLNADLLAWTTVIVALSFIIEQSFLAIVRWMNRR